MLSAEGRQAGEEVIGKDCASGPQGVDDATRVDRVPVDDGADHQVEGGGPDRQAVLAAVTEATEPVQVDRAHEAVAALALVELGRGTLAKLFIADPVEGEQGPLDTPHLRLGEAALAGRRRQLSQHERGADGAGPERGQKAQDVVPVDGSGRRRGARP